MHSLLASCSGLCRGGSALLRPTLRGLRSRRRPPQAGQVQPLAEEVAVRLRKPSELWKAAAFTVGVCGASFTGGIILRYERRKAAAAKARLWGLAPSPPRSQPVSWSTMTEGQKTIVALLGVNAGVFLLWRIPRLRPFMYRYFASSFYGERLLSPMVLSMFSHMGPLHLACNMYVLWSFGAIVADRWTGPETFLALFLAGGVVSSFAGHVFRALTKTKSYALGASGGVLCCLMYTCAKMPDSQLAIIFLPFFTFSAFQGILGILALDTAGLLLGWRLFDHAAHLGGSLFGLAFAYGGESFLHYSLQPRVLDAWRALAGR